METKARTKLSRAFYTQDALVVAKELLGKRLIRSFRDGEKMEALIIETEAYKDESDLASHARFGKTLRNKVMFERGGKVYMYLIYGIYWMLNVVTGDEDKPQGVLIRGVYCNGKNYNGPGKVTKLLSLGKDFYGEDLVTSDKLWIENGRLVTEAEILVTKRIGVLYAQEWAEKKWRFLWNVNMKNNEKNLV